ncbi:MAG: flagellar biosynthetic protein FliO [Parvibaculum sp.]|nr:flagellar biosynthetic protein FliO [Parvibaculum sp.]|tara:strand:- start:8435 stop:8800 length:366 start_codon:yes stop_codon:yes gene_type:complete
MELSEIFRFVASLVFIIGLIGLCAYAAKKLGLASGGITVTGSQKRLAIVEVKVIDAKHRLVLMRRDNKEHLVLLGGEQDLLIESGIDAPEVPEDELQTPPVPTAAVLQFQKFVDFIKERRA